MGHCRKPVRCIETKEVFAACAECDRHFGWTVGRTGRIMRGLIEERKYHFEYVPIEEAPPGHMVTVELPGGKEEYRPIPGYEGLYSISNLGNVISDKFPGRKKKTTTNKSGQRIVTLMNGKSGRRTFTVNALVKLTWLGQPIRKSPFKSKGKYIKCIEDGNEFNSYMECSDFYQFDYSTFIQELKANRTYRGKHFQID